MSNDGLSGDDAVVAAAEPKQKGTAPSAFAVVDAAVSAVARAFASLPADHRSRIFPDGGATATGLTPNQRETLASISEALAREYATRKETVARRAGVTVQSFGYSARLRDSPEVTRDFARRAGAGARRRRVAMRFPWTRGSERRTCGTRGWRIWRAPCSARTPRRVERWTRR